MSDPTTPEVSLPTAIEIHLAEAEASYFIRKDDYGNDCWAVHLHTAGHCLGWAYAVTQEQRIVPQEPPDDGTWVSSIVLGPGATVWGEGRLVYRIADLAIEEYNSAKEAEAGIVSDPATPQTSQPTPPRDPDWTSCAWCLSAGAPCGKGEEYCLQENDLTGLEPALGSKPEDV